jgi:hypothetical protein
MKLFKASITRDIAEYIEEAKYPFYADLVELDESGILYRVEEMFCSHCRRKIDLEYDLLFEAKYFRCVCREYVWDFTGEFKVRKLNKLEKEMMVNNEIEPIQEKYNF